MTSSVATTASSLWSPGNLRLSDMTRSSGTTDRVTKPIGHVLLKAKTDECRETGAVFFG